MFKEKVIVITGGSSGVGKDLAFLLTGLGAHVALIARDEKKLKSAQNLPLRCIRQRCGP